MIDGKLIVDNFAGIGGAGKSKSTRVVPVRANQEYADR